MSGTRSTNDVQFRVDATSETATKTTVETRGFAFTIDEPAAFGGADDAPNPVEYLIGAWAGCLNVVAHLVADERDIDLDSLAFSIAGDLDTRGLFGTADVRPGYQHITVELDVDADATDAELDAWLAEVESRCPVGDNLGNATPVDVTLG